MVTPAIANTQDSCEQEKKDVDRWNSILKNNSTETGRDMHRKAKERFLVCLHDNRTQNEVTNTQQSTDMNVTRRNQTSNKRVQISKNAVSTGYAAFKGKKLEAWNTFFQDSPECINNNGDMGMFVTCSTVRKEQLAIFERRWDESKQRLRPLLD